jgi:anaerobic selenocysteine-containing dehydrogenase
MRRKISGFLLATLVILAVGMVFNDLPHAKAEETDNYSFWVYQVTEMEGTGDGVAYYGTNNQYEDFPHVYFTNEDLSRQKISEDDWVIVVFNHDDIENIIKVTNRTGGRLGW